VCIDKAAGRIHLYGGWDGKHSLDDFGVYSITEGQWHMVLQIDDAVWPGRRSCHKMAFDAGSRRICLLGCLGVSDDAMTI
jgi:muskelin